MSPWKERNFGGKNAAGFRWERDRIDRLGEVVCRRASRMGRLGRFNARCVNFLWSRALALSRVERFGSEAGLGPRRTVCVLVLGSAIQVAKSRCILDETQVNWNAVLSRRAENVKTMRLKMAKFEGISRKFSTNFFTENSSILSFRLPSSVMADFKAAKR